MRLTIWMVLMALSAAAQPFSGLSTTDDGAHLYFSSPLKMKDTDQNPYPKIFRWTVTGGFELIEQREPGEPMGRYPENFYQLLGPEVSGGGGVLAYTGYRPCGGGSGCLFVEVNRATIWRSGLKSETTGDIDLSHNGRYALVSGRRGIMTPRTVFLDLDTGREWELPLISSSGCGDCVTDDGRALLLTFEGQLHLWSPERMQSIATQGTPSSAIIDPTGRTILYVTTIGRLGVPMLRALDVSTGLETVLSSPLGSSPSFSADGQTVLFVAPGGPLILTKPDGTDRRELAQNVTRAVLSGNGAVAYAITSRNGLNRIDVQTGVVTQLIAPTPYVVATDRAAPPATSVAVPGSLVQFWGAELRDRKVFFGNRELPTIFSTADRARLILPPDIPAATYPVHFESESLFESSLEVEVKERDPMIYWQALNNVALAVHPDFRGLVTDTDPAVPGEVIVLYTSGLGRDIRGLQCEFERGGIKPAEVLYAGPSGFEGVYQVNVLVPPGTEGGAVMSCGWPPLPPGAYIPVKPN